MELHQGDGPTSSLEPVGMGKEREQCVVVASSLTQEKGGEGSSAQHHQRWLWEERGLAQHSVPS